MAQRTAFLNSDAKGFNKDFHHTWISNYMLKQPGVMFSNYTTKPEFALGNGQISGGKAIIRCTRTTGTFAGEEILACFESTSTENISTAGNKKVYIEIPEVYVNDSTAITDSLTQGANLNVGRIVSSDSYPTHSNYIPLWEITNGDWQNATDLRPEVLRRGKPNTLSYFGGNGEEERIDIDNNSLNKYLMSNGAGVAPSWEEGGGGGGGGSGENFKRTFTADEDLVAKSMFGVAKLPGVSAVDSSIDIGKYSGQIQNAFNAILNGEDFDSLTLKMSAVNSPADTITVRIETVDSDGYPTGNLIDVGAYGTATPTSDLDSVTFNLAGTITGLTAHTKVAVVIQRNGTISNSNYFTLGVCDADKQSYSITKMKVSNNGTWGLLGSSSGCVDCDGFMDEAVVKSTASANSPKWLGYCETGATAGNDFVGILRGTVDYEGATIGTKYYIKTTGNGTLVTYKTSALVGIGVADGVLQIGGVAVNLSGYDAIVDAGGRGDYRTISAAISGGAKSILVLPGTYNESEGNIITDAGLVLHGVDKARTIVNVTVGNTDIASPYFINFNLTEDETVYVDVRGLTFNLTANKSQSSLLNGYHYSGNKYIKTTIDSCNINVTSGVNAIVHLCYMYSGYEENTALYNNLNIVVSDSGYYTSFSSNSFGTFTNSIIELSATGSRVALMSISNLYNCIIKGKASSSGWTYVSLRDIHDTNIIIRDNESLHKGRLYINGATDCTIEHSYGTYPSTDISGNTNIPNWTGNTAYAVGDYVWDDEELLECIEAHTSQSTAPWQDEEKWSYVAGIVLKNIKGITLSSSSGSSKRIVSIYGDNTYYLANKISDNKITYDKVFVGGYISVSNNIFKSVFVQNRGGMTLVSGNKIINSSGAATLYYADNYSLIQNNIVSGGTTNGAITVLGTSTSTSQVGTNLLMKANSLS